MFTTTKHSTLLALLLATSASILIVSCGGGGSADTPGNSPLPASPDAPGPSPTASIDAYPGHYARQCASSEVTDLATGNRAMLVAYLTLEKVGPSELRITRTNLFYASDDRECSGASLGRVVNSSGANRFVFYNVQRQTNVAWPPATPRFVAAEKVLHEQQHTPVPPEATIQTRQLGNWTAILGRLSIPDYYFITPGNGKTLLFLDGNSLHRGASTVPLISDDEGFPVSLLIDPVTIDRRVPNIPGQ